MEKKSTKSYFLTCMNLMIAQGGYG